MKGEKRKRKEGKGERKMEGVKEGRKKGKRARACTVMSPPQPGLTSHRAIDHEGPDHRTGRNGGPERGLWSAAGGTATPQAWEPDF